jgi:PAS domain S-box-containing protein
VVDSEWRITYANAKAAEILEPLGKTRQDLIGRALWAEFPGLEGSEFDRGYRRAMAERVTVELEAFFPPLSSWFAVRAYPTRDGLSIYFQDVTRRKDAEVRLAAERVVLELIATGAPLATVLERVAREAEAQSTDGMLCSVLLASEAGDRLLHGAAPSLPAAYNAAIHGQVIAPAIGSCGAAAFERRPVGTADIAADPNWGGLKELAAEHGLAACWSTPILSSQGTLLGTVAMYYREPRRPGPRDEQIIDLAVRLAGIVIERMAAERKVRESEGQLRDLVDSIPQLAWMAEPDGAIFWYNRRWYDYTGTTLEQMKGWGWQSVHDPDVLPTVMERWTAAIAAGIPFEMEFPIRGANGVFRWFLTRVNPLRNAAGEVVRWFGTNTDVDDVKRIHRALEEETRSLELLNRTGTSLASTLDQKALLQSITDAATQLSGAQFGAFFYNVIGDQGEAFMLYTLSGAPREAFEKFGHPRATALFGPTFRGEGIIRIADVHEDPRYGKMPPHHGMPPGHLPVRSYLAVPVAGRSGDVIGGLFFGHADPGVFTERTERLVAGIAAQAAVAIDNARLYEAAQQSAEERKLLLESERHARGAAERASRVKDEFLATLSHELRTPLSAILGWSHMLRSKTLGPDDLAKGLETIERNARMQTQLIEDLLDMSRITSGKVRLDVQPLTPAAFVEAAVETVRPAAEAKGVRLDKVLDSVAGPVSGDPGRLQQVVWNLLSNAIKFTPKGGRVQVVLERVDSHIEISVADTGAGIEPAFLDRVFDRFSQADGSTTRQFGGLGLGLAIVKNLVELHGGNVSARSEGAGRGATFTVRLPLAIVRRDTDPSRPHLPTAETPSGSFNPMDLSGIKILVVDDQADARELVARVLSQCQAEVIIASGAEEALILLERERPDVLVTDIGMPDVDGFELLRRVRALGEARGGKTPAIALTAFARSEDRIRALHQGFRVHVSKPVEPAELIATVASVVGRTG